MARVGRNTTEQRTDPDVSKGFNFHNRPNPSSTRDSENVGDTQNTVYLDWTAHASRPTFSTFTRFLPTTIAGEGCSETWTEARDIGGRDTTDWRPLSKGNQSRRGRAD